MTDPAESKAAMGGVAPLSLDCAAAFARTAQVLSVTRKTQQPHLLIANVRDVTETNTDVADEPSLSAMSVRKGGEPI